MENAQPEPSMEEILASIRRIISEDEEDIAAGSPAATPSPVAAVSKAPTKPVSPAKAAATESTDKAQSRLRTEDVEMIKGNTAEAVSNEVETTLLDETSAKAASDAFTSLSQSVRVTGAEGPGRTLEELVVEMLRPMVKDWLDVNLPAIVEEKVEEEVQRVARRRR